MVPDGENRFRRWGTALQLLSGASFVVQFRSADELDLELDGTSLRYRRARPAAQPANELSAFAGRYRSDELDATFVVTAGGAGLDARLEHMAKGFGFEPLDRDTFAFANITLRFERDAAGKVVAIRYTNPLLRSVRLSRVPDGA
jgi:hypothetical protein